jgi:hypothetical protein
MLAGLQTNKKTWLSITMSWKTCSHILLARHIKRTRYVDAEHTC